MDEKEFLEFLIKNTNEFTDDFLARVDDYTLSGKAAKNAISGLRSYVVFLTEKRLKILDDRKEE